MPSARLQTPLSPLPSGGEGRDFKTKPGDRTLYPRDALASEADNVHALLVEAFAKGLLPFTIFRAPQSVSRLAQWAEEGRIRIADAGIAITAGNHLAYLAVGESARGKGIGRLLMDDFHAGRGETTLDVLEDNPARRWYEGLGYDTEHESLIARFALKNTGKPPETWDVALAEERENGFSAVDHAGMRVGLLGGVALRLIDGCGLCPRESLETLATLGRSEVVMMGLDRVPEGCEVIQVLRSVRMRRKV